jgi:hypothetical protein
VITSLPKVPNSKKTYPSFSIIIEWENALHGQLWRASKMLNALSKQIVEISPSLSLKPEVIIVYDSTDLKGLEVDKTVNEQLTCCLSVIDLKIFPTNGLHYYELKNFGVGHSSNDIIIFLDSDVIPEDGWLSALLEPFQNPHINVVGGNTYLDSNNLYDKAFALFWCFPLKSDTADHVCEEKIFFANNVAFRRNIFEAYQFPNLPQFRGQCMVLSNNLWRNRIKIFRQPKSRGAHPTPKLKRFVMEALCQGHDIAMARHRAKNALPLLDNKQHNRRSLPQMLSKVRKRYRESGLRSRDILPAYVIVFAYLALMAIGLGISSIKPELIRKYISF